jgi:hypothetical protein
MSDIMQEIRRAILESGKTRYAIWKESGISQGHLSQVMAKKRTLSAEAIDKLCDTLKLEIIIRPRKPKPSRKSKKG